MDTEISINRKMTPDFMRQKPSATNAENNSDAKMKRMSAIERSETMDLSQLRRNNSFIDSRRFLEKPEVTNNRRQSNGWSDSIQDVTAKKPPLLSPRGSFKRNNRESSLMNGNLENGHSNGHSISSSSSLSNMRKLQDRLDEEKESKSQLSSSLSASNIKRVQDKSNKFLESLSTKETSPKHKQLLTSVSVNSVPQVISTAEKVEAVIDEKVNHRQILEDLKRSIGRETKPTHFMRVKIVDDDKKLAKFQQINEVYMAKSSAINVNQIYKIRTISNKEYYVRVKTKDSVSDETIEIHPVLAKVLEIEQSGEKVEISDEKVSCNSIQNIELVPLTDLIEGGLGYQIA